MLIHLDMAGDIPIYLQLRNQIVLGIGSGHLLVGEGLPTVRQLAGDIGVNPMTVNKAYALLKKEGFIEIDRRHGAKVASPKKMTASQELLWREQLSLLIAEGLAREIDGEDLLAILDDLMKSIKRSGEK